MAWTLVALRNLEEREAVVAAGASAHWSGYILEEPLGHSDVPRFGIGLRDLFGQVFSLGYHGLEEFHAFFKIPAIATTLLGTCDS